MSELQLESLDKQLLDIIQTEFPICSRPYLELGQQLGISEDEAFRRVQNMRKSKLIRRLGANFQSAKLGFRSTLCAAKVPEKQIASFVELVNSYSGVTHNYLRKHKYNIWFTYIGESWNEVCSTLEEITQKTGIQILNLPAQKLYKIKVDFQMQDD